MIMMMTLVSAPLHFYLHIDTQQYLSAKQPSNLRLNSPMFLLEERTFSSCPFIQKGHKTSSRERGKGSSIYCQISCLQGKSQFYSQLHSFFFYTTTLARFIVETGLSKGIVPLNLDVEAFYLPSYIHTCMYIKVSPIHLAYRSGQKGYITSQWV